MPFQIALCYGYENKEIDVTGISIMTRCWQITAHPRGRPLENSDFELVEVDQPQPCAGEALLKTLWLGFDPAQKGWMENVADYVAPMQIGDIMRGTGIGEVIESNNPDMPVGSLWSGMTGWTEHFVTDGKDWMLSRASWSQPPVFLFWV